MNDLIDVVGGNAGLSGASSKVQNLACQSADLAHTFLLGLVENGDLVLADEDLLRARDTIFGVVGARDVFGDLALRRQRVDGSEVASVLEGRERVVGAGCWVRFRNDFGSKQGAERVTR